MSQQDDGSLRASRRAFLAAAAGVAAAGLGSSASAAAEISEQRKPTIQSSAQRSNQAEPFWGDNQGGIVTPAQGHTYFAAFDLTTSMRDEVADLLRGWTSAAARMAAGQAAQPLEDVLKPATAASGIAPPKSDSYEEPEPGAMAGDTGETLGLPPSRLTITFGFGAGLFSKEGKDRFGLASHRPDALVELPKFVGDQLMEPLTGGDLSVQACADDPQVAFHAVRQLARLAGNVAKIRWVQSGFISSSGDGTTPRNLMGFKDGTNNPSVTDSKAMEKFIWVGDEGPGWMRGGSYVVVRRIRIALEHWDRMKVAFQEQTIGRHKYSGAPLGKKKEHDALDLDATDKDGNPVIPENAHVRLATAASNDGAQILRRSYSYNDGVNVTAERWPPWRQGLEYDAGLLFVCYQRDSRTGFIRVFDKLSKLDTMNQFVTHVGGGLFACPGGVTKGRFIGQGLFEDA